MTHRQVPSDTAPRRRIRNAARQAGSTKQTREVGAASERISYRWNRYAGSVVKMELSVRQKWSITLMEILGTTRTTINRFAKNVITQKQHGKTAASAGNNFAASVASFTSFASFEFFLGRIFFTLVVEWESFSLATADVNHSHYDLSDNHSHYRMND